MKKKTDRQRPPSQWLPPGASAEAKHNRWSIGSLAVLAVLIGVPVMGLLFAGPEINQRVAAQAAEKEQARAAETAEERRKGFHCLSAWDGSHRGVVRVVKDGLRDPGSFEHDETRISPATADGKHVLTMRYRARNGFGGMNVATAVATVDSSSCDAVVVSAAE